MTKEEKAAIIKFIKEYIKVHGYCRVGFAGEQIMSEKISTPDKENISYSIIQSGKYTKEAAAKDYKDWNIIISRTPIDKRRDYIRNLVSVFAGILLTASIKYTTQLFEKQTPTSTIIHTKVQVFHDTIVLASQKTSLDTSLVRLVKIPKNK